jgi:hypothetical protein
LLIYLEDMGHDDCLVKEEVRVSCQGSVASGAGSRIYLVELKLPGPLVAGDKVERREK